MEYKGYQVNEKDWKLFRKLLPEWQEAYMEKLIEEYKMILNSDDRASEKYWALEKKVRKDQYNSGVLARDIRRSRLEALLLQLIRDKVITVDDLEDFSEELQERIKFIL